MTRLVAAVHNGDWWRPWGRVDGLRFSTFEQGEELARGTVRMDRGTAVRELARGVRRLRISAGAVTVWEGRVEDLALVTGGIDFVAFGLWRAVDDLLYTALWQDLEVGSWYEPDGGVSSGGNYFRRDTNNRLYITPDAGTGISFSAVLYGRLAWALPDKSLTKIQQIKFDYDLTATTDWQAQVVSYSGARRDGTSWTGRSVLWSLRGNGGTQTGSQTLAVTNGEAVVLEIATYPGVISTGTVVDADYIKLTNVAVQAGASVDTDEVVRDIVGQLSADGWIDGSEVGINSTGVEVGQAVYEDEQPTKILLRLAEVGDGVNSWRVGVDAGRLIFAPPTGRLWQVSLQDLEVQSSTADLINAVYATYQTEGGATLRTTTATSASSVTTFGVEKTGVVDGRTASLTLAETVRDVRLADGATPAKRVRLGVRRVQRWGGGTAEVWEMRAGDEVVLVDLPVVTAQVAGIRFRLARVEVDVVNKSVSVETDNPTPNLQTFLLRRAVA